jgi:hypothetical protein
VNKHVNDAFEETREFLLNDHILLKNYKEQMKKEVAVTGKPMYSMKPTEFEAHWKLMPLCKTHDGLEITHSGIIIDDIFKKRA